ncbi:AAA family ATPase [Mediterranea massiliensis]|uniref:AAA family ATPase n=1 Tax=Mediterranea massiliensis TaxID=1841865 RepID=UPI0023F469BD|nr:AAA family ATPase [Mediterranea massiliensis]
MELTIRNFGPIKDAQIDFGDLTFLIGPQASGKSLSLELLKLIIDRQHIISTLRNYNYILNKKDATNILEGYFGEGLSKLFKEETEIYWGNENFSPQELLNTLIQQKASEKTKETVFYVPAQRILSIADGRPKNFMEFDWETPYVLRRFSETLRVFIQGGLGNPDTIFPMKNRLKEDVRNSINQTIFHDAKVVIDQAGNQRKMKLEIDNLRIPFMAWSAGQKEFMPLLLGIYCLSGPPTQVVNKEDYEWVIIEEPEMGLHPRAIQSVLLEIIELMKNGYKVIVSTHSTIFPEFVWAFNNLRGLPNRCFKTAMNEMFELSADSTAANLFDRLKDKNIKTYYSAKGTSEGGVTFADISTLDALSEDTDVSEWGGLSSFAGKSSEIVSRYGVQ